MVKFKQYWNIRGLTCSSCYPFYIVLQRFRDGQVPLNGQKHCSVDRTDKGHALNLVQWVDEQDLKRVTRPKNRCFSTRVQGALGFYQILKLFWTLFCQTVVVYLCIIFVSMHSIFLYLDDFMNAVWKKWGLVILDWYFG